jgi:uncharacterized protein (DUF1684 family)
MKTSRKRFNQAILLIVFILLGSPAFAQNFKTKIEKHREDYRQAFLNETRSPLKQQDLINLSFYEPDSTYLVTANIIMLTDEQPFLMPTFSGKPQQYIRYAQVKFDLNGKPQQLTIYKSIALAQLANFKDHLFLPFTDATNGKETYSGGRYIDLNAKDISNDVIKIDFNKAYNPYCAYSDGYQCPKPPTENTIKQDVNAGEKAFSGAKKIK